MKLETFQDFHLQNTYKMLVNTVLYARELDKHKALTRHMRRTVVACNYHLGYIGYELHRRQVAPTIEYNKYKMRDGQTATEEEAEDWS